ncbi:MAG TPA: MarR family transcriptional regulator [Solirubrobacteraceae bacterium]|nr:MarR family transcriptional regulator [Solirubrobacteraceae bacterium]
MITPDRTAPTPPATPRQAAAELRATLGLLYRRLRQTRAGADLTLPEGSALSRLDQHGPTTGAQLARIEQVSPQSIGATLRSLEAKGLIGRAPDPRDGRRVILSLTDAGRETLRSKRSARTEQMTRALAALNAEERSQLIAVLPVLEHLAEEL